MSIELTRRLAAAKEAGVPPRERMARFKDHAYEG